MSPSFRFPGEDDPYRRARNPSLQAEIDLRRRVEEVAALRRQLPLGGEAPEDYVFEEGSADLNDSAKPSGGCRLSQLFQTWQRHACHLQLHVWTKDERGLSDVQLHA